jgi:polynucleotide 5'-kinase involved in rRNA processing
MIERSITAVIENSLSQQAAMIIGPHQVGKATLARAIADKRPAPVYLDREDQDRLAEQTLLLREYES